MSSARQRQLAILRPFVAGGLGLTLVVGAPLLSGCGAGQVTQTSNQVSAVGGAQGDIGLIAARNVMLAYPQGGEHFYRRGEDAALVGYFINTGTTEDELTSVRTSSAEVVQLEGVGERGTLLAPQATLRAVLLTKGTGASAATSTPATSGPASSGPATTGAPSGAPTSGAAPSGAASSGAPSSNAPSSSAPSPSSPPPTSASAITSLSQGQVSIVLVNLREDVKPGKTIKVTFLFRQAGELTLDVPVGPPAEGSGS